MVFSPQNPEATKPAAAPQGEPLAPAPRDPGRLMHYLVAGAVASLAIAGLLLLTFFRAAPEDAAPEEAASKENAVSPQSPAAAPSVAGEASAETQGRKNFRVVDLPESTRKKIHADYQRMIASSFGKSKRIPKSGAAGQALEGMLQGTVERERRRMALIYDISEEDILQIVAEGEAKGW
jgi:hypothetical protein